MKTLLLFGMIMPVAALASYQRFSFENPPVIGVTKARQKVALGGVSALHVVSFSDEEIEILALTDRGPNAPKDGKLRPFLIPDYTPRLLRMKLDRKSSQVTLNEQIELRVSPARFFSGKPPYKDGEPGRGAIETAVDLYGKPLGVNPLGIDPEGLCAVSDGSLWVSDEYGPSLFHFSRSGQLIEKIAPGSGLPDWVTKRPINNGFEGLACEGNKLYALLQAPLDVVGRRNGVSVYLLEIDPLAKKTTAAYLYRLESKDSKLGDLARVGSGRFLVIEQNGKIGDGAFRKVYEVDLTGATNLMTVPPLAPDLMDEGELSRRIKAVAKKEVLDLAREGFDVEKAEGISLVGQDFVLVVCDNDFGVAGNANFKKGTVSIDGGKRTLFGLFNIRRGAKDARP